MSDVSAAQPGGWSEPYRSYQFKLILEPGIVAAHFTRVEGLGIEVETIAYREAGSNSIVRQLAGRVHYAPITLSYGLTSSADMWDWVQSSVTGVPRRMQVTIAMLDPTGVDEVLRWDLRDAWPSAWRGAPLDAMGQTAAMKELTLVHEGLTRNATAPTAPAAAEAPPA